MPRTYLHYILLQGCKFHPSIFKNGKFRYQNEIEREPPRCSQRAWLLTMTRAAENFNARSSWPRFLRSFFLWDRVTQFTLFLQHEICPIWNQLVCYWLLAAPGQSNNRIIFLLLSVNKKEKQIRCVLLNVYRQCMFSQIKLCQLQVCPLSPICRYIVNTCTSSSRASI